MENVKNQGKQVSIPDFLKGTIGLVSIAFLVIFVIALSSKSAGMAVLFVGIAVCYFLYRTGEILREILEVLKKGGING